MLLENISHVYKRISHAAMRAGRDPSEVVLIAVTKTVSAERIKEAVDLGIRLIGENRVQEAKEKIERLRDELPETVQWHMIGHLQKNKVRPAVMLFDMIQSVDSIELARKINRVAADFGKVQRVLIQVKLSEEETKHGVSEEALEALVEEVLSLENLSLEGLMTIPPFFEDPELVRPYFRRLRQLRDKLNEKGYRLKELSMGMSGDYEVAVEEGATMVRVGTAIFGRRSY
ncbi:MAG: YggS family pyridoxal phosphate-dependent enzyme [Nitrospirae bacterium]|nr:YggS family pyridoxal phosphate-dependent enzyme [Nitrospirota bacterium]